MYTARGPNWAARWRPVSRTRIDGTRRLRRAGSRPVGDGLVYVTYEVTGDA